MEIRWYDRVLAGLLLLPVIIAETLAWWFRDRRLERQQAREQSEKRTDHKAD